LEEVGVLEILALAHHVKDRVHVLGVLDIVALGPVASGTELPMHEALRE
jgi:hypothetical protein